MASLSFAFPLGPHCQTTKCLPMLLACWVMGLFQTPSGFRVLGLQHNSLSIGYKELFPIVVAAALWGHQWVSWRVEFLCNNKFVVAVPRSGTFGDQQLMLLPHHLSFLTIHRSFAFTASSVPGKANPVADALSRFQFQHFRCQAPHDNPAPCQVHASLLAAT